MLDSWGAGEDWCSDELDRRSEKIVAQRSEKLVAQDDEFGNDK